MTVLAEVLVDTHEDPEITFVRPILGLGESRRFTLDAIDELGALFSMRSLDIPDLRLVVAAPAAFFDDYAPDIDEHSIAALGLRNAEDALLLVVLTVGETLATSTANLLAPIVVNTTTRAALQVVTCTGEHPLRAPLAA